MCGLSVSQKLKIYERKRKSRMLKKQKEIESEGNAVSENQTISSTSPSTSGLAKRFAMNIDKEPE